MKATKKNHILLTAAVFGVLLAGCSASDPVEEPQVTEPQAVVFDAYLNRSTSRANNVATRGGYAGALDLDVLKTNGSGQANGFGVFAYYTDGRLYSQTSLPDFMYNQQVTYDTDKWTYSPVKYWPNETGASAVSAGTDHLTFFAYAPYTEVDVNTGRATDNSTTGIVGLSRAIDSGDPFVRYFASMNPAEAVDLCWANPTKDATKPAVNTNVTFNFKHALAALNVQIDADVDAVSSHTNALDGKSRIYVRSVTFKGFADRGQLNLNNDQAQPRWNNLDCDCDLSSQPITIYDGRRDGREGVAESLNEQKRGLNPAIIQSGVYTVNEPWNDATYSTTTGVTNTAVNLFNSGTSTAPIYVIPTNEPLVVTIVYDVETYDPKLISQFLSDGQTHGSTIENNITATTALRLSAGRIYTLNLHLGMTSVKMDAQVTEWEEGGSANVNVPD